MQMNISYVPIKMQRDKPPLSCARTRILRVDTKRQHCDSMEPK